MRHEIEIAAAALGRQHAQEVLDVVLAGATEPVAMHAGRIVEAVRRRVSDVRRDLPAEGELAWIGGFATTVDGLCAETPALNGNRRLARALKFCVAQLRTVTTTIH